MSTITLTPAQHAILAHALEHSDGRIDWFQSTSKAVPAARCSTAWPTAP